MKIPGFYDLSGLIAKINSLNKSKKKRCSHCGHECGTLTHICDYCGDLVCDKCAASRQCNFDDDDSFSFHHVAGDGTRVDENNYDEDGNHHF